MAAIRPYHDPEVLHELYHEQGLSPGEIGAKFGVSAQTIMVYMIENEISPREDERVAAGREATYVEEFPLSRIECDVVDAIERVVNAVPVYAAGFTANDVAAAMDGDYHVSSVRGTLGRLRVRGAVAVVTGDSNERLWAADMDRLDELRVACERSD